MPFKDPSLPLGDIQEAITSIEDFTAGMDFEDFRQDPKTVAAVERKLNSSAKLQFGWAKRLNGCALACSGGIFAAWGIGYAISTIGSISKRFGAR